MKSKESSQMSVLNIFFSTIIVWGLLDCDVPLAFHIKQSARVTTWGGMTGCGLTKLHKPPASQTSTFGHYINQIFKKEVKPSISRRQVTGGPMERKLFSSTERGDICSGWTHLAKRISQSMASQRTLPILIQLRTSGV